MTIKQIGGVFGRNPTFNDVDVEGDLTVSGVVNIKDINIIGNVDVTGTVTADGLTVDGGTIKLDGNYPVGTGNVALGNAALGSGSLSGGNNVALGYQAGYANETGQYNTFLGYKSGLNNVTSSSSTYVGTFSGELGTGLFNTYVGDSSGYAITTGTRNTIIGRYSGNQGGLDIRTSSNNIVLSDGDGNPRVVVDSSGNVLVGSTTLVSPNPGHSFSVGNGSQLAIGHNGSSPGTYYSYYSYNGSVIGSITQSGTTSVAYNTSSDYRLKTDAQPMIGASERVQALKPINFAWKVDGSRVDGFLAHEAQSVVPECATGTKDAMRDEEYEVAPAVYEDIITPAIEAVAEVPAVYDADGVLISEMVPAVEAEAERTEQRLVTEAVMGTRSVPDYQGIDQSKLVPLLTAALQEALTAITDLKARVTALEGVV
jgi:hypothetical protein